MANHINHGQPWQSYRQISTQTATSGQLVVMLYDGAIRFLERALSGFSCQDPLEFNLTINNNVLRAQAIISELNSSLDQKQGGQIAITLHRLYDYMDRCLSESNCRKSQDGIQAALRHLTVLRDAWRTMLTQSSPSPGKEEQSAGLCICG
ncbi:MAG: flagellar export chaperone FliS [Candidatus Omnitrophica bacterium]|nr:flagellar export chaperone FliS [Candidatus Omnitrophota bacterium]